jgi:hypothetical protein
MESCLPLTGLTYMALVCPKNLPSPKARIWGYLKYRELSNVVCQNREQLLYELRLATARLRHKPHVIEGCITQASLSLLMTMQQDIRQ